MLRLPEKRAAFADRWRPSLRELRTHCHRPWQAYPGLSLALPCRGRQISLRLPVDWLLTLALLCWSTLRYPAQACSHRARRPGHDLPDPGTLGTSPASCLPYAEPLSFADGADRSIRLSAGGRIRSPDDDAPCAGRA